MTVILDIIHVVEYVWKAAHVFHEDGSPELACWAWTRVRDILEGKARRVAAAMRRAATVAGLSRGRTPAEDAAEGVDGGGGELGEVGEGSLLDAAAVAEGLSEEDGGRRGAVGDALDIHGYYFTAGKLAFLDTKAFRTLILHGYVSPDKNRQ